jgi:hypothetical protein
MRPDLCIPMAEMQGVFMLHDKSAHTYVQIRVHTVQGVLDIVLRPASTVESALASRSQGVAAEMKGQDSLAIRPGDTV